jgi:hypothetical protein
VCTIAPVTAQLLIHVVDGSLNHLLLTVGCCTWRHSQDFLERKDSLEAELASLKAELAAKVKDYEYRLT